MKEPVNIQIDVETGKEIKSYLDQGYRMSSLELLKGLKGNPDIYFVSLKEMSSTELVSTTTSTAGKPVVIPAPQAAPAKKVGDGDAERMEQQEPFVKPVKDSMIQAEDPNRPTLKDVINKIVKQNKDAGLQGSEFVKKCVDDITALKYEAAVEKACLAYLNTIV